MFLLFFFQLENVSDRLLDYGILGMVVIAISFISYKMYNKINDDQSEWRNIAKQQLDHNHKASIEQNRINQTLIEIRERDVDQNKQFHYMLQKKLEDFPKDVRQELRNELLEQNANRTSANGS